jgi:FtsZ-binding cell division protein ZapB
VREDQNGMGCDLCEFWYHCGCVKINVEEYKKMKEMGDKISWFCKQCKEETRNTKGENEELKKENEKLKEENNMLKERLTILEGRLEEMKMELKSEIVEEVKIQVMESIKEEEERKKRQKNLVIYRVKESRREQGSEREQDDMQFCQELFKEGIKIENVKIEKVIRLGKVQNDGERERPRPILVKLEESKVKWEILKKARELRNANLEVHRETIIAPDLTPRERERDRELREELMQKRRCGESGWYIRRGELVRGSENFQRRQGV